jgi:hypothetical protein
MRNILGQSNKAFAIISLVALIHLVGSLLGAALLYYFSPGLVGGFTGIYVILPIGVKLSGIPLVAGIILSCLALVRPNIANLRAVKLYDLFFGLLMVVSGLLIVLPLSPTPYIQLAYLLSLEAAIIAAIQSIQLRKRIS